MFDAEHSGQVFLANPPCFAAIRYESYLCALTFFTTTFSASVHPRCLAYTNIAFHVDSFSKRSPRGGEIAGGRIHRTKTHVIQIADYAGREALIIIDGRVPCPLHLLFSFAIYFTQLEATKNTVKLVELLETIKRGTPLDAWYLIPLGIFFLPLLDLI